MNSALRGVIYPYRQTASLVPFGDICLSFDPRAFSPSNIQIT